MRRICAICKATDAKYKCPICLVYYCSVACCNQHRMNKCDVIKQTESQETQKPQESKPSSSSHASTALYPTDDTVELNKLHSLAGSNELKDILSNRHLRDLLSSVNQAENAEAAMASAMQEPIFVEFANACLAELDKE